MGKPDAYILLENPINTSKHCKQLEIFYETLGNINSQWFLTVSNLGILFVFFTCRLNIMLHIEKKYQLNDVYTHVRKVVLQAYVFSGRRKNSQQ